MSSNKKIAAIMGVAGLLGTVASGAIMSSFLNDGEIYASDLKDLENKLETTGINESYLKYMQDCKQKLDEQLINGEIKGFEYDAEMSYQLDEQRYWDYVMASKDKKVVPLANEYVEINADFDKKIIGKLSWFFGTVATSSGLIMGSLQLVDGGKKEDENELQK